MNRTVHEILHIPALSIRQPWAWAIINAGKRIENREWRGGCKYRGPVLIHASLWPSGFKLGKNPAAGVPAMDAHHEAELMLEMAADAGAALPDKVTLRMLYEHRGGIVGRANVVGVIQDGLVVEGGSHHPMPVTRDLTPTERAWWVGGFGIVLDDVEPLPFVPCKGALGFFKPTFDAATVQP